MKLLVGLGNPGGKYARNRHNIGFMAVDAIAEAAAFDNWRKRFQGEVAEGRLGNEKCLLLKPTTYMNESGRAVGEAVRFYKLGVEDVIVFHDDLDLVPGKVRVKVGGGNAGHNGLRSISAHIGNDYLRVRLGIGHPGRKDLVQHYVLNDFAKADAEWLEPLLEAIARTSEDIVAGDGSRMMNEVATVMREVGGESAGEAAPQSSGRASKPSKPAPADDGEGRARPGDTPGKASTHVGAGGGGGGAFADKLRGWLGGRRGN